MEKLNKILISLGSDLGDRFSNLNLSIKKIEQEIGEIVSVSKIYETPPYGFESSTTFLNACIEVQSPKSAIETLENLQKIEIELGRIEKSTSGNYKSRIIDLDILLFNQKVINSASLTVPHNGLAERKFVLKPLCDIAKTVIHPISNLTIEQLLANCDDKSKIRLSNFQFSD